MKPEQAGKTGWWQKQRQQNELSTLEANRAEMGKPPAEFVAGLFGRPCGLAVSLSGGAESKRRVIHEPGQVEEEEEVGRDDDDEDLPIRLTGPSRTGLALCCKWRGASQMDVIVVVAVAVVVVVVVVVVARALALNHGTCKLAGWLKRRHASSLPVAANGQRGDAVRVDAGSPC